MVRPAGKHRADCAPELDVTVLREGFAQLIFDQLFVKRDDVLPFNCRHIGIVFMAEAAFLVFENFLEQFVVEAHDDIAIHLNEAAVAVPGETGITRIVAERLDGAVVEAKIENGVHHARHGGARA